MDKIEFSPEWLARKMRKYRLSKIDVAKKLDIHPVNITFWLNGTKVPSGNNLVSLISFFDYLDSL